MHIAILGSVNTLESIKLKEEIEKRGHTATLLSISDCIFEMKKDSFSVTAPVELNEVDVFIVRGISRSYDLNGIKLNISTENRLLLKYLFVSLNKVIIDEALVTTPRIMSKMSTALTLANAKLPYPATIQFISKEMLMEHKDKITYPVIAKPANGRQGKNIFKLDNEEELMKLVDGFDSDKFSFLLQEFLPNDGDIRVLVVGGRAIGAMKRHTVPDDFRSNISLGAKANSIELTPELTKLAEAAATVTKTEIAGVDIMESDGDYYIIEVNRAPQFKGFMEYTGMDVPKYIIDYAEEKFEKQ